MRSRPSLPQALPVVALPPFSRVTPPTDAVGPRLGVPLPQPIAPLRGPLFFSPLAPSLNLIAIAPPISRNRSVCFYPFCLPADGSQVKPMLLIYHRLRPRCVLLLLGLAPKAAAFRSLKPYGRARPPGIRDTWFAVFLFPCPSVPALSPTSRFLTVNGFRIDPTMRDFFHPPPQSESQDLVGGGPTPSAFLFLELIALEAFHVEDVTSAQSLVSLACVIFCPLTTL